MCWRSKPTNPWLAEDVAEFLTEAQALRFADVPHTTHRSVDSGRGRLEIPQVWATDDPDALTYVDPTHRWTELRSLAMVQAERRVGDITSRETRYYISSLPGDAQWLGAAVRRHWAIENELHWVLYVAFGEVQCRARTGHAVRNFAPLRRCALNFLRRESSARIGIKAKRLRAG